MLLPTINPELQRKALHSPKLDNRASYKRSESGLRHSHRVTPRSKTYKPEAAVACRVRLSHAARLVICCRNLCVGDNGVMRIGNRTYDCARGG